MYVPHVAPLFALALALPAQEPASRPASTPLPLLEVLAPAGFVEALAPFVAWKRAHGLRAEVTALEDACKAEGGDDAERVKRWLFERRRREAGLRYVLLVGDADYFPVRYMVLDRVTKAAFDYAFYPSDLYYADLCKRDGSFEDWNGIREGFHARYFGEVRGEKNKDGPIDHDRIDYLPELAVGRWPVATAEEVARVAAKTIAWEKALAERPEVLARAALFAVHGWVECRPGLDAAAAALPKSFAVDKRYWKDAARDDQTPPPSRAELVKLVNGGLGFVLHAGHGEAHAWAGCCDWGVIDALHNESTPCVMMSIGCTTARFATLPPYEAYLDEAGVEHAGTVGGEVFAAPPPPPACYQKGRFNPPGLGELLVRKSAAGAVAYVGCNTGGQPCAMTLLQGFCKALGDKEVARLGDAWAGAVAYYHAHERLADLKPDAGWYPPSVFFQAMKYMLFGDPSLPLPGRE
jgi:hypothetical protein